MSFCQLFHQGTIFICFIVAPYCVVRVEVSSDQFIVPITGRWQPSVAKATFRRFVYTGDQDAAQENGNYFDFAFVVRCVGVLNRKIWFVKYYTTILIVLNFSKKLHALQRKVFCD